MTPNRRQAPRSTKRRQRPAPAGNPALGEVIEETRLLFHRLKRLAEQVHGQGEATAGKRGVLRDLAHRGPRTVPQLARARPVSRQHIQVLVNGLLEEGLVERAENPAHRRSPLVRLTAKGARRVERMEEREAVLLARLRLPVSGDELETSARVLRALRRAFEGTEWKRLLEEPR
jgi:DNA-binding MarR family transcriptional regulator